MLAPSQQDDWFEVPFDVPPDTELLQVRCFVDGYTFAGEIVDLGIRDNERVRGYSGGARDSFVLGRAHATPGYLAGEIRPGSWALIIASNRLPELPVTVRLDVECITAAPRWLAGDLHSHTVHSDGSIHLEFGHLHWVNHRPYLQASSTSLLAFSVTPTPKLPPPSKGPLTTWW